MSLLQLNVTPAIATEPLRASQIDKLSRMLKDKLLTNETGVAKSYLNLLVDDITVTENMANVKGSYAALASTANVKDIKLGTLIKCPVLYRIGARSRSRTGTPIRREILSLLCLPISPPGRMEA